MPGYIGAQLSLELTNLFPVKEYAQTAISRLVDFARDLRKSGTDIVVEEDVAAIFGRGRVSLELEQQFKTAVQPQQVTPLYHGSHIELRHGPGPTMMRGFRDPKYFAAILTLSMLSYFHPREDLATMIAVSMTKRFEANVPDASSDPGFEGIADTLRTCSTESTSFNWSYYSREIENRLRRGIPEYAYQPDYTRLTPAVFLGAMDFLYIVQRFPEDRRISVSAEMGCIPLTIWAHYILGLTVIIKPPSSENIVFGSEDEPHVLIHWVKGQEQFARDVFSPFENAGADAIIRLHEKDMSVVLSVEPDENNRLVIAAEERHPLLGYGTNYLERILNVNTITLPSDPMYEESVKLTTGLALQASRGFQRNLNCQSAHSDPGSDAFTAPLLRRPTTLDSWRILRSAKALFHGLPFDLGGIDSYANVFANTRLDKTSLPNSFTPFLGKVKYGSTLLSPADRLIMQMEHLARLILVFAFVAEVDKCGEMPIILSENIACFSRVVNQHGRSFDGVIGPQEAFHAVVELLSSTVLDAASDTRRSISQVQKFLCLCSDFGWSVFLDTVGDKDPAAVMPELVHVQKGTPTNNRTSEKKLRIRDGTGLTKNRYPHACPVIRGLKYVPRTVARVTRRDEYWTTQSKEFELTLYYHVRKSEEWPGGSEFEEATSYRDMHDCIWQTFCTPECKHNFAMEDRSRNQCDEVKLGPDAATMIGWDNHNEEIRENIIPERILIYLTRGERLVRWLAVVKATKGRGGGGHREVMVRTRNCCDTCALEYVASQPGRWILIL